MEKASVFLFITAIFVVLSCSTPDTSGDKKADDNTVNQLLKSKIVGKWELTKTADLNRAEKAHNGLSVIVMNIQQNGFFIIYDTFIDPEWKKKGLPLIEQRAFGQWNLKNNKLTLTYGEDQNSKVEALIITKLTENELVTHNNNSKATVYKTYGRK